MDFFGNLPKGGGGPLGVKGVRKFPYWLVIQVNNEAGELVDPMKLPKITKLLSLLKQPKLVDFYDV